MLLFVEGFPPQRDALTPGENAGQRESRVYGGGNLVGLPISQGQSRGTEAHNYRQFRRLPRRGGPPGKLGNRSSGTFVSPALLATTAMDAVRGNYCGVMSAGEWNTAGVASSRLRLSRALGFSTLSGRRGISCCGRANRQGSSLAPLYANAPYHQRDSKFWQ